MSIQVNEALYYLLGDHLGSTSITLNATGQFVAELRYKAFGETRYTKNNTPTDYRYTGQLQQAEIGLYYYGARWYDPMLGRFTQADTVIAAGVQGMDRYAYTGNNPINFTDPSGHERVCTDHDYNGHIVNTCIGMDYSFGIKGSPLTGEELLALTLAVMGETSNGSYDEYPTKVLTWTYLNRISRINNYAPGGNYGPIAAVQGDQSAFKCYYQTACDPYDAPILPKEDGEDLGAYAVRLNGILEKGKLAEAWARTKNLVGQEYSEWLEYGSTTPFDEAHGHTDFRAKYLAGTVDEICKSRENGCTNDDRNDIDYEYAMYTHYPYAYGKRGVGWFVLGGSESQGYKVKGTTFWIFISTQLRIDH